MKIEVQFHFENNGNEPNVVLMHNLADLVLSSEDLGINWQECLVDFYQSLQDLNG